MDTDSLMSKQEILIPDLIDKVALGKWKCEKIIRRAEIYGSKFYRVFEDEKVEGEVHCKGVKKKAMQNEEFWTQYANEGKVSILQD